MSEPIVLNFDLLLNTQPVMLKEGGQEKLYTLQELTGSERDKYLNFMKGRMKVNSDGTRGGIDDFNGLQARLLSMTLKDPEGKLVPEEVLQKWPARVQTLLFKESQKLSGLDDKAEEKAKND